MTAIDSFSEIPVAAPCKTRETGAGGCHLIGLNGLTAGDGAVEAVEAWGGEGCRLWWGGEKIAVPVGEGQSEG